MSQENNNAETSKAGSTADDTKKLSEDALGLVQGTSVRS